MCWKTSFHQMSKWAVQTQGLHDTEKQFSLPNNFPRPFQNVFSGCLACLPSLPLLTLPKVILYGQLTAKLPKLQEWFTVRWVGGISLKGSPHSPALYWSSVNKPEAVYGLRCYCWTSLPCEKSGCGKDGWWKSRRQTLLRTWERGQHLSLVLCLSPLAHMGLRHLQRSFMTSSEPTTKGIPDCNAGP